jgi:hypothetical protein
VFNRLPPHNYVNYFTVDGVGNTDGIDITNVSLNTTFQAGIFLCHDGTGSPYVIRGSRYEDLGLLIDTTYWDPRNSSGATSIFNTLPNPGRFFLEQNYPNPFNPETRIDYTLPEKQLVTIIVYNTLGEEVAELVNEEREAGSYSVLFDASGLPSGVYIYRLQTSSFADNKKMTLLK